MVMQPRGKGSAPEQARPDEASKQIEASSAERLTSRWWGPLFGAILGLWHAKAVFGALLPSGSDMPYHFARVTFGASSILSRFRLDGWMPNFGQGSQAYLLYGSGTTMHFALLRILSLGLLSNVAVFQMLVAASLVLPGFALTFAGRQAGFSNVAANIAGLLSLAVGVTGGIGYIGLYSTGLLPHQIAATWWLLALGLLCRLMREPRAKDAVLFAGTAAVLAFVHPTSLWILALTAACLLCANACSARIHPGFGMWLVCSAGFWLIFAAGWWLPLFSENEPRQGLATWGVQPIRKQLGEIINGRQGFQPLFAGVTILCFALLLGAGARSIKYRPLLALPLSGFAAFVLTHFLYAKKPGLVTLLLPVRSVGNIALLFLLPIGWALHQLSSQLTLKRSAMIACLLALPGLVGPYQQTQSNIMKVNALRLPDPRLVQTAASLHQLVPTHARWAMIVDWPDEKQYGVDLPQFWLASQSGRLSLNGFGGDSVMAWNVWQPDAFLTLPENDLAALLRRAGVTHVLAPGEKSTAKLTAVPNLFQRVDAPGALALFAVRSADNKTVGSTQLIETTDPSLRLKSFSNEHFVWETKAQAPPSSAVLAIGYTPKWKAHWNGQAIKTVSDAGQIRLELPAGPGKLDLRYQIPTKDRFAGLLSIFSAFGFGAFAIFSLKKQRQRKIMSPDHSSAVHTEIPGFAIEGRDDWNSIWKTIGSDMSNNPGQSYRRKLVLERLKRANPKSIIDIGCGQGELLQEIQVLLPDATLSGVDLSEETIGQITKNMPSVKATACDLTLPSGMPASFHGIAEYGVCTEVLEHLDDPVTFLRSALRAVQPGGTVLITVPAGLRNKFERHIGHRDHFTIARLRSTAQEAGLTNVEVQAAGFPFFNLYKTIGYLTGPFIVRSLQKGKPVEGSTGGQLAYKIFGKAFKFNMAASPFGWQLLATGTVPSSKDLATNASIADDLVSSQN